MEGCITHLFNPRDPERNADREMLERMKENLKNGFYDDNPESKANVEKIKKMLEDDLASYDFSKY